MPLHTYPRTHTHTRMSMAAPTDTGSPTAFTTWTPSPMACAAAWGCTGASRCCWPTSLRGLWASSGSTRLKPSWTCATALHRYTLPGWVRVRLRGKGRLRLNNLPPPSPGRPNPSGEEEVRGAPHRRPLGFGGGRHRLQDSAGAWPQAALLPVRPPYWCVRRPYRLLSPLM